MIRLCIKELAEQRGISKPIDLARKTGLSFSVVHKLWNEQQTRIDLKTVESLCNCLGVGPGQLFEMTPPQAETSAEISMAAEAPAPARQKVRSPSWID